MTPTAYLSQCFGEDGQNLGYTVWDRPVPGAIPVVPHFIAEDILTALLLLYRAPEFDGTRETSRIRREAKRKARAAFKLWSEA